MSNLVKLRRTDPYCGYEQICSCATWAPSEGWINDLALLRREQKQVKHKARRDRSRC